MMEYEEFNDSLSIDLFLDSILDKNNFRAESIENTKKIFLKEQIKTVGDLKTWTDDEIFKLSIPGQIRKEILKIIHQKLNVDNHYFHRRRHIYNLDPEKTSLFHFFFWNQKFSTVDGFPRTVLASERTILSWTRAIVSVVSLSLLYISLDNHIAPHTVGKIFIFVASFVGLFIYLNFLFIEYFLSLKIIPTVRLLFTILVTIIASFILSLAISSVS